ncbi:Uncharacterised protein at_DN0263 [Pycnogonum litorale]
MMQKIVICGNQWSAKFETKQANDDDWLTDPDSLIGIEDSVSQIYLRGVSLPTFSTISTLAEFVELYSLTEMDPFSISKIDQIMKKSQIRILPVRLEIFLKTHELRGMYLTQTFFEDQIPHFSSLGSFKISHPISTEDLVQISHLLQSESRDRSHVCAGLTDLYKPYSSLTSAPYKYLDLLKFCITQTDPTMIVCTADGSGGCTQLCLRLTSQIPVFYNSLLKFHMTDENPGSSIEPSAVTL